MEYLIKSFNELCKEIPALSNWKLDTPITGEVMTGVVNAIVRENPYRAVGFTYHNFCITSVGSYFTFIKLQPDKS